jgi:hypothetical protein
MCVSQIVSHSNQVEKSACRNYGPCRGRKQVEITINHVPEEEEGTHGTFSKGKKMAKLLTIQAVQNELSISRSSTYRLIGKGKFDVVYVLNAPRITAESVELFIAENLTAGSAVAR